MSRYQWIVSTFLVWHIFSFGVGSLGNPEDFHPPESTHEAFSDPLTQVVKPVLDTALGVFEPVASTLFNWAAPLRRVVTPYIQSTAIPQGWQMFKRPPEYRTYVRVRYFWREPGQGLMRHNQLIFPADREDRIRGPGAYWNKYRNKAISNSYRAFLRRREAQDDAGAERPADLQPVLAHYSERFRREVLPADATLTRVELWHGRSPIPSPGTRLPPSQATLHRVALADYYAGLEPTTVKDAAHTGYDERELEADIQWTLLDIQEP